MQSQESLQKKWPVVIAGLILMAASATWAQVDTIASVKQEGEIGQYIRP